MIDDWCVYTVHTHQSPISLWLVIGVCIQYTHTPITNQWHKKCHSIKNATDWWLVCVCVYCILVIGALHTHTHTHQSPISGIFLYSTHTPISGIFFIDATDWWLVCVCVCIQYTHTHRWHLLSRRLRATLHHYCLFSIGIYTCIAKIFTGKATEIFHGANAV